MCIPTVSYGCSQYQWTLTFLFMHICWNWKYFKSHIAASHQIRRTINGSLEIYKNRSISNLKKSILQITKPPETLLNSLWIFFSFWCTSSLMTNTMQTMQLGFSSHLSLFKVFTFRGDWCSRSNCRDFWIHWHKVLQNLALLFILWLFIAWVWTQKRNWVGEKWETLNEIDLFILLQNWFHQLKF